MRRRQTIPYQWLILARPSDWNLAERLPLGSGILLLTPLSISVVRGLRLLARERKLEIVIEGPRSARRVHNVRELRAAMLQRTPLILLSPLYPTTSHPDWQPLPRMRAAALARLGGRTLLALGGMDARRFARIRKLGFRGWAGITAFRT
ncbi:MAG TPA: thiamine phosphate synthase [Sphingomicrobium sp.]|jgi:thiamine-phosphate pyrophosphorylase|nr:thiamine phosphate synthase [Sphingomicrobium sp.]